MFEYTPTFSTDDLLNVSEVIVLSEIERLRQENYPGLPETDIGLQDVAAIALNNMPPKYICSPIDKANPGESLRKEMEDLRNYARRQILKAIERVKTHPHD